MSDIDFLIERFRARTDGPAIAWRDRVYSYGWLADDVAAQVERLTAAGIGAGSVVVLESEYAPAAASLLLALIELKAIGAPLLPLTIERNPNLIDMVDPAFIVRVSDGDQVSITPRETAEPHEYYTILIERNAPGLVLFTSGSTGKPKGVVHDFSKLLEKFKTRRGALITLNLLMFDHWGGLNTLLHGLANDCLVVLTEKQTPDYVCELMERHKVELLPATPSFLNMMLISRAYEGRDLSALRLISYGAEPMPSTTLKELRRVFPDIETRQTYGLIELGVLRAKSQSSDSLWVKIGGDGYDIRVVDDMLQIKADAAMLGYLNAPSPFTDDGYFMTGDRVEVDGDYFRILGRDSELINVGGQKVYPAEVEAVLLDSPDVENAVVFKQGNPIMGQIVCANINRRVNEGGDDDSAADARARIKKFCARQLDGFKVPVKINFVDEILHSDRMKRLRTMKENNA
ncbi:MAG: ANL family adenylate-forming protein [Alphaproteobacteria bacterium]